jgi:hypothetical protein
MTGSHTPSRLSPFGARAFDNRRRSGGRRGFGANLVLIAVLAVGGWILGAAIGATSDGAPAVLGPFSYFPS